MIVFTFTNSVDLDEMQHCAAFRLGLVKEPVMFVFCVYNRLSPYLCFISFSYINFYLLDITQSTPDIESFPFFSTTM